MECITIGQNCGSLGVKRMEGQEPEEVIACNDESSIKLQVGTSADAMNAEVSRLTSRTYVRQAVPRRRLIGKHTSSEAMRGKV